MLIPRFIAGISSVGLTTLGADVAFSQDFPSKPIRLMVSAIGSASDTTARIIAPGISGPLGQQVIVDNRGGNLPAEMVAKAPPDGYTLLIDGGTFWIGALLRKVPYDVVRDYAPISITTTSVNVLVVHPSLPVKSVKDLIVLAKAKPGELSYTSGDSGGTSHLAGELFKSMAGVNIVRIPYSSGTVEMTDLMGGNVPLSFAGSGTATPHIKSGRLKAIAVTSAQPSALFPGLPTIAASGLPGVDATGIRGVLAPAKTPTPIINRLNQEMVRFLGRQEVKEQFLNIGLEAAPSTPEELAARIKVELTKWAKVIKDAGIKAD